MNLQEFTDLSNEQLDSIDALSDAFEQSLRIDEQVAIEGFLSEVEPTLRRPLFRELLQAELEHLGRRITSFRLSEYTARFPEYAEIVVQFAEQCRSRV